MMHNDNANIARRASLKCRVANFSVGEAMFNCTKITII